MGKSNAMTRTLLTAIFLTLFSHTAWAGNQLICKMSEIAVCALQKCPVDKANSASGGLNKWLHQYVPDNCVIHSFRHSLRDRLRAVECPSDIVDAIGGWKTSGIGHGYGNGYPLNVLEKWMKRITH